MGRGEGTALLEAPAASRGRSERDTGPLPPVKLTRDFFDPTLPEPSTHCGTIWRTTSSGERIRLECWRDDEQINEEWVVDQIEAFNEAGEAIGYIKTSYIPPERRESECPTPLHWATRQNGRYGGRRGALSELLAARSPEQWGRADLITALGATDRYVYDSRGRDRERGELSEKDLRAQWEERLERINEDHGPEYERSMSFHFNRPLVDFIRVYGAAESRVSQHSGSRRDLGALGEDYRGRGVGRELYQTAAIWMRARGLQLHASGLQSEEAQGAWAAFERQGLVKRDGERRVFDADELLRRQPELALS